MALDMLKTFFSAEMGRVEGGVKRRPQPASSTGEQLFQLPVVAFVTTNNTSVVLQLRD
jgi:hypothetical protein